MQAQSPAPTVPGVLSRRSSPRWTKEAAVRGVKARRESERETRPGFAWATPYAVASGSQERAGLKHFLGELYGDEFYPGGLAEVAGVLAVGRVVPVLVDAEAGERLAGFGGVVDGAGGRLMGECPLRGGGCARAALR